MPNSKPAGVVFWLMGTSCTTKCGRKPRPMASEPPQGVSHKDLHAPIGRKKSRSNQIPPLVVVGVTLSIRGQGTKTHFINRLSFPGKKPKTSRISLFPPDVRLGQRGPRWDQIPDRNLPHRDRDPCPAFRVSGANAPTSIVKIHHCKQARLSGSKSGLSTIVSSNSFA